MNKSEILRNFVEPGFQKEILKEPRQTLKKLGVNISENTEIKVVRNNKNELNVVIPTSVHSETMLSDSDLAWVTAGEVIGVALIGVGSVGAVIAGAVASLFALDILSY